MQYLLQLVGELVTFQKQFESHELVYLSSIFKINWSLDWHNILPTMCSKLLSKFPFIFYMLDEDVRAT